MSASYSQVIYHYDYVPTLLPHTEPNVAWLGGGEGLHGRVELTVAGGERPRRRRSPRTVVLLSNLDRRASRRSQPSGVSLRFTEANGTDEGIVTFHNQDKTRVWTGFSTTLDATDWAGTDAVLEFSGTGIDGFTHFFVDSISLVATVCE